MPTSAASLAFVRIALGLVMLLEAVSCFLPSASTGGRVPLEVYYTGKDVTFSFPYEGFGWLPSLPAPWMEGVCILMGLAAFSMALGFYYRASAIITFLTWGYLYALESTRTYWMSYYYLEVLLLFLMIWMPAARCFSVDARRNVSAQAPLIPFWPVFLLRSQLVIAYFYAGFAKLNGDWLFEGVPMRMYLEKPHVAERLKVLFPAAASGGIDRVLHAPWLAYFLSWSGAAFDLGVGFLLIFRRTRTLGMVLLLLFHGINHFILFDDIVWFPLLGVATATIFLEPDWPLRFWKWMRRPKSSAPDWKWFWGGGLLVPGVGVALGWKANPATASARKGLRLPSWTAAFVLVWLGWQTLVPLRHLLISGDARFTFEGLSWSWRLKTEVYGSKPCVVSIHDAALYSTNAAGTVSFNWSLWSGEKALYRQMRPERTDWSKLPEIVVLLEPVTGDRIFYNVQSSAVTDRSDTAVKTRIETLWRKTYGRPPESVSRVVPLAQILDGYERAMRGKGHRFNNAMEVFDTLIELNGRDGDGQMVPVLRRMEPFSLMPKRPAVGTLFLIEDGALFSESTGPVFRLNASAWRRPETGAQEPPVVLRAGLGLQEGELLPRYYVADMLDEPGGAPHVRWNLFKDVGPSKAMHVGMQPFLLRRYARRVAAIWENEFSRRPQVHAITSLSLNGHPEQMLVGPDVDLASVQTAWVGHNPWIRDFVPGADLEKDGVPTSPEPLRSLEEAVPRSGDRAKAAR